jgi:flavin-binding protein dodecin
MENIINLDSVEYKTAFREATKRIKLELSNGTKLEEIEVVREPGDSNNSYYACIDALKKAKATLKKQQEKTVVRKREPVVVGEIREYYGKKARAR